MGHEQRTGEQTDEQTDERTGEWSASAEPAQGRERSEWDTSPLYEAPAGPDNLADGVVAIVNTLVAALRSLRHRVSSWRAGG